jgi:hypothetical protein
MSPFPHWKLKTSDLLFFSDWFGVHVLAGPNDQTTASPGVMKVVAAG